MINSESLNPENLIKQWDGARPFPHVVIDQFFHPDEMPLLQEVVLDPRQVYPHTYDSPFEKGKSVCNDMRLMPSPLQDAFAHLCRPMTVAHIEDITGIRGLQCDFGFHGGGLHRVNPGGKLDIHLDYAKHPTLNLTRRLSLVVYLTDLPEEQQGGELEFWNADMTECVTRIRPKANRAVLFENTDHSFHGHPEPLPLDSPPRLSLACFYLTKPEEDAPNKRPRARFFARPQDDRSAEFETLRLVRAGLAAQ